MHHTGKFSEVRTFAMNFGTCSKNGDRTLSWIRLDEFKKLYIKIFLQYNFKKQMMPFGKEDDVQYDPNELAYFCKTSTMISVSFCM